MTGDQDEVWEKFCYSLRVLKAYQAASKFFLSLSSVLLILLIMSAIMLRALHWESFAIGSGFCLSSALTDLCLIGGARWLAKTQALQKRYQELSGEEVSSSS